MRALTLVTLSILGLFVLNSCVVWKFDTLLRERNRDDVPNIAGRYVDSEGQTVNIRKTEYSNTFMVTPASGTGEVKVTMENIAPNRYLVQGLMANNTPGLPTFLITVAEIEGNKITVYFFLNLEEEMAKLGAKHDVTYEPIGIKQDPNQDKVSLVLGVLTAYNSVDDLIAFFNDLFTLEDSQKVTITKR